jgi:hypothetical protein
MKVCRSKIRKYRERKKAGGAGVEHGRLKLHHGPRIEQVMRTLPMPTLEDCSGGSRQIQRSWLLFFHADTD